MDVFRCSCQRLMIECPFWQEVQDRALAAGIEDFALGDFRLKFGRPGLFHRIRTGSLRWTLAEKVRDATFNVVPWHTRTMRRIGRRNREFANIVLDATKKRVFADTSKEATRVHHLHRYLEMDLRAVHLVRDVRGVVSSSLRRHGEQLDVGAAAAGWSRTNRTLMRHLRELEPSRRTLVRYEDLCRDPAGTMAALYAFCGVDPSVLPGPLVSYQSQHLLGNRARLQPPTEIRLDERWRSSLSSRDLAAIASSAAPMMELLYPGAIDPLLH